MHSVVRALKQPVLNAGLCDSYSEEEWASLSTMVTIRKQTADSYLAQELKEDQISKTEARESDWNYSIFRKCKGLS